MILLAHMAEFCLHVPWQTHEQAEQGQVIYLALLEIHAKKRSASCISFWGAPTGLLKPVAPNNALDAIKLIKAK